MSTFCLQHQVAFNVTNSSCARLDIGVLSEKIRNEIIFNSERYINFIDAEAGLAALTDGMNEYISHKRYDTSFGDLVPVVIANAIHVDLVIVSNNYQVVKIKCRCGIGICPRTLILYKTGNHYDSIVPVNEAAGFINSPTDPSGNNAVNQAYIRLTDPCTSLHDKPEIESARACPVKVTTDRGIVHDIANGDDFVSSEHSVQIYSDLVQSLDRNRGFRIGCLNIRGLLNKIDEMKVILQECKFDVMGVCETFIDDNIADHEITIEGYSVVKKNRTRHGGGVLLYIKDSVRYTVITELAGLQIECVGKYPIQKAFPSTWSDV